MVDPAEKVVQHSVLSPLPEVLTDAEIETVLLAADRYRRQTRPDARPLYLAGPAARYRHQKSLMP